MNSGEKTTGTIFKVAVRMLQPLLKLCLRKGMRIQELTEALKFASVAVASSELDAQGLEVNASRLSVVTGIQRKEIKRILNAATPHTGAASFLSRILGKWQADPRFCDEEGKPRSLTVEGAESEFALLVQEVSVDLNSYTALFGLEQSGAVVKEGGYVRLIQPALDIGEDTVESIELLAKDSEQLYAAVTENIFDAPAVPHLHLTTEYDNVCVEDLPAIREWILDRGTTFHEEVRAYVSKFDKDLNPRLHAKEGGAAVRLTAFSFSRGARRE